MSEPLKVLCIGAAENVALTALFAWVAVASGRWWVILFSFAVINVYKKAKS